MVTFPRGVFWPYRPAYGSAEPTYRGLWARIGWAIAPRPRRVWITTAVVLGIMALGLTGLKASGLTNAQGFRGHPDSVTGQIVLAAHFPAGTGSPVIVIGNASAAGPLRSAVAATPGIAAVTPPVTRAGYAYLQGTLTAPPDSQAAFATIDRVRSAVAAIPAPAPWPSPAGLTANREAEPADMGGAADLRFRYAGPLARALTHPPASVEAWTSGMRIAVGGPAVLCAGTKGNS